jgi:hypothetical protein
MAQLLNYPSNFVSTADHTLYFTSYDINWNSSINSWLLKSNFELIYLINGDVQSLTIDASNNLYFVYYDYDTSSYEITKITPDGTTSHY